MTNHKERAEEYVDFTFRTGAVDDVRLTAAGKAQVHATLYLAEQQRVANLIAYVVKLSSHPTVLTDMHEADTAAFHSMSDEIRTSLGLE